MQKQGQEQIKEIQQAQEPINKVPQSNQSQIKQTELKQLAQQLDVSVDDIKSLIGFKQLLSNYIGTTEFTICNPNIRIMSQIRQMWDSRKTFGNDKKIHFKLHDVVEQSIQSIKNIYSSCPSVILTINGHLFEAEGIIKRDNDVYYEGNAKNMLILYLQTGSRYNGPVNDLQEIKPHGYGYFQLAIPKSMSLYEGYFENGERQGFGAQRTKNVVYQGQWDKGKKHGYGRETTILRKKKKKQNQMKQKQFLSQSTISKQNDQEPEQKRKKKKTNYDNLDSEDEPQESQTSSKIEQSNQKQDRTNKMSEKSVQNSQQMSEQKMQIPKKLLPYQKSLYVGSFIQGKRAGNGTQLTKNGKYIGEWAQNTKNGKGTMLYKSGAKYIGMWHDDFIHGQGIYTDQSGNIYQGQFENGCRNGTGSMKYINGDVYEGAWQNNCRQGQGIYTYAGEEGDYYDGQWIKNAAEGEGTSMIDGVFYMGSFFRGMKHGMGEQTDNQGNTVRGIWKDNQLVETIQES